MAAPGTAYVDDPDLGTDRQPKHQEICVKFGKIKADPAEKG
jgi:hypothetical protein